MGGRWIAALVLAGAMAVFGVEVHADTFQVDDIEVVGLQRISPGTLFTYLPVEVGDRFDEAETDEVIRALYQTDFFSDVELRRRGDVLIVEVRERPAIAELNIEGNEDIDDEDLNEALRSADIAPGRTFNRSVLERLEYELVQQYLARGKYSVNIETDVTDLERNRVAIDIQIYEGEAAEIRSVNIVGNRSFDEKELIEDFESGLPNWLSFFTGRGQYSQPALAGDLETLRSYYLDRGYLQFEIESTQVSITPDRQDIYITVNIHEGEQYTVEDIELAGTFIVPEEELRGLLKIGPGDTFSRAQLIATTEAISQRLGDEGYAFANVNPVPEVDEEDNTVGLTFFVDPGQRVYVRRIVFRGNRDTSDEVFRREMRQLEGGWYSTTNIELSRRRLQRLPFVAQVDIETERVPGVPDQVDLIVTLEERLAGNFAIGAGYSQSEGFLFNLSLVQNNFLGTGREVGIAFNNSDFNTIYSLSYTNPYYTIDGISRSFSLSYRETDSGELDVTDFDTTRLGGAMTYGIPLSEFDTLRLGIGGEAIEIEPTSLTSREVLDFLRDNGDDYDIFSLTGAYVHDTRNRTVFADRGSLQLFELQVTVPGGDLDYYKANYENQFYLPLFGDLTLGFGSRISYGAGYGDTGDLPFFENYYAGGFRTVRGYEANSLGPLDSQGDPFGGSFRTTAQLELIFPVPFVEDNNNFRLSAFFDAGNVFADTGDFETGELRTSAGIGVTWITLLGALQFSIAEPLNEQEGDETEAFQFNIGTVF